MICLGIILSRPTTSRTALATVPPSNPKLQLMTASLNHNHSHFHNDNRCPAPMPSSPIPRRRTISPTPPPPLLTQHHILSREPNMRRRTPLIFIIHPQPRTNAPSRFRSSPTPIIDIECIRPPSIIHRTRVWGEWWRRIGRILIVWDLGHKTIFYVLWVAVWSCRRRRLDLDTWRWGGWCLRLFPMRRPTCHYPTRLRGLRLSWRSLLLLLNLHRNSGWRAALSPRIVAFLPFPPLSASAVAFLPFLIAFFSFSRVGM